MEFRILGPLEAMQRGQAVKLRAAKLRALLGLLLVHAGEVVSADRVIEALWGDRPPRSAPKLVHVYVSQLRAALGEGAGQLVTQAPGYVLRVEAEELDSRRFESLLQKARSSLRETDFAAASARIAEGLSLWRGPALVDFAYESWAQAEASRLEELRLAALEDQIDAELGLGRHEQLVARLRALVEAHPLRERVRARLMTALYRSGRQAEALDVYRDARATLVERLGLEPGQELQALEAAILNQHPSLDLAPTRPEPASNLPPRPHRLVGRERDLEEVQGLLLQDAVRLVTIVGPGGGGKTRLAVEAAAQLLDRFPDGVRFVDLAPVTEPELVGSAIAQAVGVQESGDEPLTATLARSLADRRMLLVLDNFEHVASAAPDVAALLHGAQAPKVLVTSRSVLRLSAEHVYELPPLTLDGAMELLIERAKRVRPDFRVTEESGGELESICARLDGLPLAIELAAARLRVMTPTGLLARLDRRLPLLTGAARDAPARQQTLTATIAWSYGLLRDDDRTLFDRLGVFAGPWTLAAVEEVCAPDRGTDVVDGLDRLLEINLVRQVVTGGEPRFWLLETIREFALDRLAESGAEDDLRRRHAEHYLALAEREWPELRGRAQAAALSRLDAEHPDLRAAIAWACRAGRSALAVRLAAVLWRFWWVRGHLAEGRRWLDDALALPGGGVEPGVRAAALEGAAALAWGQDDAEAAESHAEEALALFREAGETRGVARALNHLGLVAQARAAYARARGYFEESGALAAELGNDRGHAVAVVNLGGLALIEGDYGRARELAAQGLRLHREQESKDGEAISLLNLGFAALEQGDLDEAESRLRESLEQSRALGFAEYVSLSLEGLAGVAAARGELDEAARQLGRSAELREDAGASLGPYERGLHERTVAAVEGLQKISERYEPVRRIPIDS